MSAGHRHAAGPWARGIMRVISLYQGWSATRLPNCRFTPSCSQYAKEAVDTHGAGRGLWLAGRRVTRCRPGGAFGYDPVTGKGELNRVG